ncbi:hydroxymethylbilane synthase [Thermodesulfobacteriota bacterium]
MLKTAQPGIEVEIEIIKTLGDRILDTALSKIGDKGLFTKEIEQALLQSRIDIAVHSLKDLPSLLEPGLCIGAVLQRENPCDVLIAERDATIDILRPGAAIGTSSLRRTAQLTARRPDISIVPVRGNVETRINKIKTDGLDGIILAYAGVKRLGFAHLIAEKIPFELMLPAVGQGAVAVEIRENDPAVLNIVRRIHHQETAIATASERSFLRTLEGGCQVPIGCLARCQKQKIAVSGVVAALDGKNTISGNITGSSSDAELLGKKLAQQLLSEGADKILNEIYNR